jgi:hypothetical protein
MTQPRLRTLSLLLIAVIGTTCLPTHGSRAIQSCRAEHMRMQPRWGAAAGSYGGSWQFTNTGGEKCFFSRAPNAELLDKNGRVLLTSDPRDETQLVILDRGSTAESIILWSNWCRDLLTNLKIRIVLPNNGGDLTTDAPGVPSCNGSAPAVLSAGPFRQT